jgi:hypothetical protein
LALLTSNAFDRIQIELELIDAALNFAPVGFKLRFTGSASADAAAQLRHRFASAGQSRQHVLELCQLNLQLALSRSRVAGEDVEDELCAVKNAARKRSLKVAQLRGTQIMIEENESGFAGCGDAGDLFNLALTDERGGIGLRTPLHHLGCDIAASTANEFAKLGEGFVGIKPW